MIDRLITRLSAFVHKRAPAVLRNGLKRTVVASSFVQRLFYDTRLLPDSIAIENIVSCNRRCPYCPHSLAPRPAARMSERLYEKLIGDLRESDYRGTIVFAPWSEPLLDERLTSFVALAKARLPKCGVFVQTNGDALTPEKYRELRRAGVGHIDVSDHFARSGGRLVIEPPKLAVATYQSLDERERKNIHFHDLNYKRVRRIERFHNRSGLIPLERQIPHNRLFGRCFLPESCLTVAHDGRVALCCVQWTDSPTYGNVENEDIAAIWNNPEFKRERKKLRKGIYDLELCRRCGYGDLPDAASSDSTGLSPASPLFAGTSGSSID